MDSGVTRRSFLNAAGGGMVVTAGAAGAPVAAADAGLTILGIACSPRKGKTTAAGVKLALDAAAAVDARIKVKLLDLGGMDIGGWTDPAGRPAGMSVKDDFDSLLPDLRDPGVAGLIVGSPVYFRTMSALCKAFLERCGVLRSPVMLLADKPAGVLTVGAYRNGGQELVIGEIQAALLCYEMMLVGGRPRAFQGATLLNMGDDDITKDKIGMDSARELGARVAEAALRLARARV